MSRVYALVALFGFLVGLCFGRWMERPTIKPITPAEAVRLDSGALVIERTAQPAPSEARTELPRGATLRRVVSVQIQPRNLEPLMVNLAMVDTPDGPRVIADAPSATVTGGMDYPNPEPRPKVYRWAVGPSFGWEGGKILPGIAVTYQTHQWTLGTIANRQTIYGFVAIRF